MYRIRTTGAIVTQHDVRALYPTTSFPDVWTVELLEHYDLDPILESPAPATTPYQTAYKDGVEQIKGEWMWKWSISEMDDDAKAAKEVELKAALLRRYEDATLAHLNAVVKAKDYDSIEEAVSYALSSNKVWADESQAAITWRDAVWTYYYAEIAKASPASLDLPPDATTDAVSPYLAGMPTIAW